MNTIVEACDKISDTASAHDRTFIIEVMGRDCGYLAMTAAVASGADIVLFPEDGKCDDELVTSMVDTIDLAPILDTYEEVILGNEYQDGETKILLRRIQTGSGPASGDAR